MKRSLHTYILSFKGKNKPVKGTVSWQGSWALSISRSNNSLCFLIFRQLLKNFYRTPTIKTAKNSFEQLKNSWRSGLTTSDVRSKNCCPVAAEVCLPCRDQFVFRNRDGIFKLSRSPGIYAKESFPPGYIGWRASTTTRFLAPIVCKKIPAHARYPLGGAPTFRKTVWKRELPKK